MFLRNREPCFTQSVLTHTRDGGNSVRVAATCLYQYRPLTAIKDNSQSSPWSPYRLKSLASPPLESPFTSRCQIVCAKAVQQPCTYSGGISTALLKNSLTFSGNVCGGCLGSCVAFCFDRISSLSHVARRMKAMPFSIPIELARPGTCSSMA